MKKASVPYLEKIIKPNWAHKPGYGYTPSKGGFYKHNIWEQGTTPEDGNLLKKLGLRAMIRSL